MHGAAIHVYAGFVPAVAAMASPARGLEPSVCNPDSWQTEIAGVYRLARHLFHAVDAANIASNYGQHVSFREILPTLGECRQAACCRR